MQTKTPVFHSVNDSKPEGFINRSPSGLALRVGVSPGTIYNEIKRGRLHAKKIGRRTLITADQEREWLDNLQDYEVAQ